MRDVPATKGWTAALLLMIATVVSCGESARSSSQAGMGGAGGGTCSACATALATLVDSCNPGPTATCVQWSSGSQAADGTTTNIGNICYSDGTKSLTTDTVTPPDAGTAGVGTFVGQLFKNGTLCATTSATRTLSTNAAGAFVNPYVFVFKNGSGDVIATLTATSDTDGGTATTSVTITCPGEPPEPYVDWLDGTPLPCTTPTSVGCTTGTCM